MYRLLIMIKGLGLLLLPGILLLNGCATGTAVMESCITPPSISDTLDSFESAALAIKASNRVLTTPLCETSEWPMDLWHPPKTEKSAKIGVALFGMSKGVTIPMEFDPETGFPRPTSALYLLIKDRMEVLDKASRDHIDFFRRHPGEDYYNPMADKKYDGNPFVYKSTLCAYGTVMNNRNGVKQAELEIRNYYNGYEKCDAWIKHSEEGQVEDAACKAAINSDEVRKDLEEKAELAKEDLETQKRQYERLSNRVYRASIAGADFTAAAAAKIISAILKAPTALRNAETEFKGWKGAVNTAMLLPRVKNVIKAFGVYKDHLGLQVKVYRTMAFNIRGKYEIKDDEKTKSAWRRIDEFQLALEEIEPKLARLENGDPVEFEGTEIEKWDALAASFSDRYSSFTRLATDNHARSLNRM